MDYKKMQDGKLGEDIAATYLEKQGFKIIERNFRIRGGEIDIIALDPSAGHSTLRDEPSGSDSKSSGQVTLAFVEVKTRRSNEFGSPLEAITPWKLRALIRSAQFYKVKHPKLPDSMRIDAVAIVLDSQNNVISIELTKNISG